MTIHQKLAQALRTIINGGEDSGRWLDASGTECSQDDDGAQWREYTEEEQQSWLESCAAIARKALEGYEEAASKQAALLQQARDALELAMLTIDSRDNPETAEQVSAAYEAMVAGVPTWRPTVHVIVEGGNVTEIISDVEGLHTAIVDYDTNGCDEADLHSIPQSNGTSADATGHLSTAAYHPDRIAELEKALEGAPNYRTPAVPAQPGR